jgi:hypothetical protein
MLRLPGDGRSLRWAFERRGFPKQIAQNRRFSLDPLKERVLILFSCGGGALFGAGSLNVSTRPKPSARKHARDHLSPL